MSDILIQKKISVERCVKQVRNYYIIPSEKSIYDDCLKQDVVSMNLYRACQQCIDMANHVICMNKLGLPAETAESFKLLRKENIIDEDLEEELIGMMEFRNLIIYKYQEIDYRKIKDVVNKHTADMIKFAGILVAALPN